LNKHGHARSVHRSTPSIKKCTLAGVTPPGTASHTNEPDNVEPLTIDCVTVADGQAVVVTARDAFGERLPAAS
jgi:hypothetical protein